MPHSLRAVQQPTQGDFVVEGLVHIQPSHTMVRVSIYSRHAVLPTRVVL